MVSGEASWWWLAVTNGGGEQDWQLRGGCGVRPRLDDNMSWQRHVRRQRGEASRNHVDTGWVCDHGRGVAIMGSLILGLRAKSKASKSYFLL